MPTTGPRDSNYAERQTILIVGASARYCAESAVRAGYECIAVDLFADWDLQLIADTYRVNSLDEFDSESFANSLPRMPNVFMTAGGMEKRPELITEIARRFPYCGTHPEQISRTNDPFAIANVCEANAIPFPKTKEIGNIDFGSPKNWLMKPFRSAGGSGISFATFECFQKLKLVNRQNDFYAQQTLTGLPFSSVFYVEGSSVRVLGSTRQLVGLEDFTTKQFVYCGSIGPIQISEAITDELIRIGTTLVDEFELEGVFGIDWIEDRTGSIWLVEINPRLTSSAEILEISGVCQSVVQLHLDPDNFSRIDCPGDVGDLMGKAVVYSDFERAFVINRGFFDHVVDQYESVNRLVMADIPCEDTIVAPGSPILTIYEYGENESEVLRRLIESAKAIKQKIKNSSPRAASS